MKRHPREVLLRVPNAPFRERLLHLSEIGEVTARQVAFNAGWVARGAGDTQRLRRALGLAPKTYKQRDGTQVTYFADSLEYEAAEVLCHAMYADPAAVGV